MENIFLLLKNIHNSLLFLENIYETNFIIHKNKAHKTYWIIYRRVIVKDLNKNLMCKRNLALKFVKTI